MRAVEKIWQSRFASLLSGSKAPFTPLDPDADVNKGGYNALDFDAGLKQLQALRATTITDLKDINPEDLALTALHPKYGPMSIQDALIRMESHDRGHADQFRRTLEAIKAGAVTA